MTALTTIPQPVFSMSDMERVATAIARGGLFGSTDPNAVLTLCMVAQAEGKHPGLVMQQYHLINGKPAKKAEAMQVDFLASGGKIEWSQLDDEAAEATFSHPMGGRVSIRWDMARAKKAGLNSPMWGKYPRQMLRSRTISEGVRTVFPGATSGMYVPEEMQDMGNDTPAAPVAQRVRDLKPEPAALPSPDTNRRKAEDWAKGFKDALDCASDVDAIDALFADGRRKNALDKLKNEHADLYEGLLEHSQECAAALRETAQQSVDEPAE